MIRPLLAAAAVLAVAAPSAAAHGGGAPDAEIFATNNTALITSQNDPRLDDRLYRFADRVEHIVRDGGGKPRGSELLDGVFFDGSLTFERSRRFDVDHVSRGELNGIAETVRRRFLQGSVLTFDHLDRRDPDVDAIELDVPHVSAKALRDGLVKDPEAAARLFGGSVTQDRHLLLVAALEDAELARAFAKKIGGDVKRAQTSYGEREFVSADTDGRARIEKRTLVITGTELDDTVLLREGRRLAIDFKARRCRRLRAVPAALRSHPVRGRRRERHPPRSPAPSTPTSSTSRRTACSSSTSRPSTWPAATARTA